MTCFRFLPQFYLSYCQQAEEDVQPFRRSAPSKMPPAQFMVDNIGGLSIVLIHHH